MPTVISIGTRLGLSDPSAEYEIFTRAGGHWRAGGSRAQSRSSGLSESDMPQPGVCGAQKNRQSLSNRIFGGSVSEIGDSPW